MSNHTITRCEYARLVHAVWRFRAARRECMRKHAAAATLLSIEPTDPDLATVLSGPGALTSEVRDDVTHLLHKMGVTISDPPALPFPTEAERIRDELINAFHRGRQQP